MPKKTTLPPSTPFRATVDEAAFLYRGQEYRREIVGEEEGGSFVQWSTDFGEILHQVLANQLEALFRQNKLEAIERPLTNKTARQIRPAKTVKTSKAAPPPASRPNVAKASGQDEPKPIGRSSTPRSLLDPEAQTRREESSRRRPTEKTGAAAKRQPTRRLAEKKKRPAEESPVVSLPSKSGRLPCVVEGCANTTNVADRPCNSCQGAISRWRSENGLAKEEALASYRAYRRFRRDHPDLSPAEARRRFLAVSPPLADA